MKSTVLYRALLYVLLPMLAAHVLVTALHVQEQQETRQAAMQQRVRTAAETIAATLAPSDSTASVRLAAVAERQDFARLWLVNERGIILASSIPSESGSAPDPEWRDAIQEAGGPTGGLTRFVRNGTPYLVAVQPVNRLGTVDLYITSHHGQATSGSAALVHRDGMSARRGGAVARAALRRRIRPAPPPDAVSRPWPLRSR